MNRYLKALVTGMAMVFCLAGFMSTSVFAQDNQGLFPPGEYMSADKLPERVKAAARGAKPGIVMQKARLSWEIDEGIYTILGRYYGQVWRLKVTSSGEVLSVKRDS